jgi:adenine-specific DNA-methyltransferase
MPDQSSQVHRFLQNLSKELPEIYQAVQNNIEHFSDIFNQSVGDYQKFQLTWPGKEFLQNLIEENASSRLVPHPGDSINWTTSENVFVEGENLEALKLLRKTYISKIKTIYIDPPYNTGKKHFVFQDHFSPSEFDDKRKARQPAGSTLHQANHHHTQWLSMMYPRLVIARQLLREDGIIFISIDENELANLKLIMDEIFGSENFVEIFSWAKSETPANLSRKSKKIVEYILCYQKKKNPIKFSGIRKKTISSNGLLNQSNKPGTMVFPCNKIRTKIGDQFIPRGLYGTDKYAIHVLEDTAVAEGVFIKDVVLKAKFKWTQPKLDAELKKGTIINIPTLKFSPSYERAEYDAEVPPNLINYKVGVATNETAGHELAKLFGAKVFDFPKPPSLLKYLLGFSDDPQGIILDFFAGSGSTAQAVLEMNNEGGGNRKFICVQIDEQTPETSAARQHGFKTISQITKSRIEKVIEKMSKPGNKPGFRFFTVEKEI